MFVGEAGVCSKVSRYAVRQEQASKRAAPMREQQALLVPILLERQWCLVELLQQGKTFPPQ
eukprot:gene6464-6692_t